ncbi:hypothetical protein [Ciceribacter sp. L1K22]|uniref:hypothetical protein n=1 Tax=Ciceribacter sp. L1K22 TaxID=2820275 RepID=UPI001ABE5699|nr:hypothetical protein [Ciceribacter sp. L1K22]MBO3760466.1 hypothetical protein [Ciceribacter sp. L1K22]
MADQRHEALAPAPETLARIRAEIDAYNAERAPVEREAWMRRGAALMGFAVAVVALLLVVGAIGGRFIAGLAGLAIAGLAYGAVFWSERPLRRFRQGMRDRLLPLIFGFVDDLSYKAEGSRRVLERFPKACLPHDQATFRDEIGGTDGGFRFLIGETVMTTGKGKGRKEVFRGVIVAFAPETGFPGILSGGPRPVGLAGLARAIFGDGGLEAVTDESLPEAVLYEFRTDNAEAASGRLPALGKALAYLVTVWPQRPIRIVLHHKHGFLLVATAKDFFELPHGGRALDFDRDIRPMILDLRMLVETARLAAKV